jgi:membrane protease YdiL (CAAX protease family)
MGRNRSLPALVLWCAAVYVWVALGLFWLHSALLTMVVYHAALCGGGWLLLRPKHPIRFDARRAGMAGLALLDGFVLTWLVMEYALPLLPPQVLPDVTLRPLHALGVNPQNYAAIALYFGLVNPLAEEALWRGRVLPMLADARSVAPNLVQSLVFAGFHVIPLVLMFSQVWLPGVVVFVGGFVFGLIALRTRGLLIPWALHAGANAYLLIWFGRFISAGN